MRFHIASTIRRLVKLPFQTKLYTPSWVGFIVETCGYRARIDTKSEKWVENTSQMSCNYYGDIYGEFLNLNIENILEIYLG
jgi:hypothetical protein